MAETIWLQQLQSYSHFLANAGQRFSSYAGDWLLHQQGLYALGNIFAAFPPMPCSHGSLSLPDKTAVLWQSAETWA